MRLVIVRSMETATKTTTRTSTEPAVMTHWPPVIHIIPGRWFPRPGTRAICGARIMGIPMPKGSVNCEECLKRVR